MEDYWMESSGDDYVEADIWDFGYSGADCRYKAELVAAEVGSNEQLRTLVCVVGVARTNPTMFNQFLLRVVELSLQESWSHLLPFFNFLEHCSNIYQ
ncbi:hypothetical protein PIB30_095861 [Stylosanthes scabra]|uniref:Uncharacterized protein n=1 Tax=Stylosanthes scabra TaxID=79078 RepID=A0ABU6QV68_9FABA|nr:hypothetical protein [Stylosanthes scabra]